MEKSSIISQNMINSSSLIDDKMTNDIKKKANEMKSSLLNHFNESITRDPKKEPSISSISLRNVQKELNRYEEFLVQNNIKDNDLESIKSNFETALIEGYKQDKMWSHVLSSYNKLKKNTAISNQYTINLNIGNIFISHGRYSKSIQNYEEGIIQLQGTNNNKLLAFFYLNCGIAQVFLGDITNSLVNFQKAIQFSHSILISYNLVLYHFIFSSNSELQKAYTDLLQESIEININEQEKAEQFNLILRASCLVAIKDNDMYEFVIERLKASQYSELAKELETTFSNEKSRDSIKENLQFYILLIKIL